MLAPRLHWRVVVLAAVVVTLAMAQRGQPRLTVPLAGLVAAGTAEAAEQAALRAVAQVAPVALIRLAVVAGAEQAQLAMVVQAASLVVVGVVQQRQGARAPPPVVLGAQVKSSSPTRPSAASPTGGPRTLPVPAIATLVRPKTLTAGSTTAGSNLH